MLRVDFNQLLTSLADIVREVNNDAGNIITERVQPIMEESQEEVPVDTGTLRDSNFISQPQREGNQVRVTFGYGGENDLTNPKTGQQASEYMLAVHERLDLNHVVGKAKFLEDPVNRARPNLEAEFGEALQVILNKRRGG